MPHYTVRTRSPGESILEKWKTFLLLWYFRRHTHCNVLQCTKIYNACIIGNVLFHLYFDISTFKETVILKLFQINVFLYISAFVLCVMTFLWTEGCKEDEDVHYKSHCWPDESKHQYQSAVQKLTKGLPALFLSSCSSLSRRPFAVTKTLCHGASSHIVQWLYLNKKRVFRYQDYGQVLMSNANEYCWVNSLCTYPNVCNNLFICIVFANMQWWE